VISEADYFGQYNGCGDDTEEVHFAALAMLDKVNDLLVDAESHGVALEMNPATKTLVSGQTYGGFRPQSCTQGAVHSSHKEGRAVDVYDPHGDLDKWITDLTLEKYGLYREHPLDTVGWCHLSDKAPGSGRRTFHP